MNEINYGEVFGVDTGANESAPAQQTDEKTNLGTQPSAAGADRRGGAVERTELSRGAGKRNREAGDDDVASTETTQGENEAEAAEQPAEGKQQSAEENARYAAARRKAEQERDAAIARARAEAQRALDESIRGLGLKNPCTGRPITTKAEYDAWKRAEAGIRAVPRQDALRTSGTARDYQRAAEAASRQQQKMVLSEQLGQIAKLDPTVRSVEDLLNRPEYQRIYGYVRKGLSIPDAFKLVNYDALTASAGNAARQAAMNAAKSKEHLAPTSQRGAGSLPVPADVKAQYRLLNPGATEAEIREHYNRFHKK